MYPAVSGGSGKARQAICKPQHGSASNRAAGELGESFYLASWRNW